jgi:hypothetical protein
MQGLNQHVRAEDCTGSEGWLVATGTTGGTFLPRKEAPLHLAESEMEWGVKIQNFFSGWNWKI